MLVNMCLTSLYINSHFLRYEAHHFHIQGFSDMFLLSTSMCICHTYYIDSGYNVPMPTLLYYVLWFAFIILHKNRRAVKIEHSNTWIMLGRGWSHSQFSRSWISLLLGSSAPALVRTLDAWDNSLCPVFKLICGCAPSSYISLMSLTWWMLPGLPWPLFRFHV